MNGLTALALTAGVAEGASVLLHSQKHRSSAPPQTPTPSPPSSSSSSSSSNHTTDPTENAPPSSGTSTTGPKELLVPSLVYGCLSLPLTVIGGASPSLHAVSALSGGGGTEFRDDAIATTTTTAMTSGGRTGIGEEWGRNGDGSIGIGDVTGRRSDADGEMGGGRGRQWIDGGGGGDDVSSRLRGAMDHRRRRAVGIAAAVSPPSPPPSPSPEKTMSQPLESSQPTTPSLVRNQLREDNRRAIQAMRDNRRSQNHELSRNNDNTLPTEDGLRSVHPHSTNTTISTHAPPGHHRLIPPASSMGRRWSHPLLRTNPLPTAFAEGMRGVRILSLGSGIVLALVAARQNRLEKERKDEESRVMMEEEVERRRRGRGRDVVAVREFVERCHGGTGAGAGADNVGVAMRLVGDGGKIVAGRVDGGGVDSYLPFGEPGDVSGSSLEKGTGSCVLPILCADIGGIGGVGNYGGSGKTSSSLHYPYWSLQIPPDEDGLQNDQEDIPFTKTWLFGRNKTAATTTTATDTNMDVQPKTEYNMQPTPEGTTNSNNNLQGFLLMESDVTTSLSHSIAKRYRHHTKNAVAPSSSLEDGNVQRSKLNSHIIRHSINRTQRHRRRLQSDNSDNNDDDDDGTSNQRRKSDITEAVHVFIGSTLSTDVDRGRAKAGANSVFVDSLDGIACAISTTIEKIEADCGGATLDKDNDGPDDEQQQSLHDSTSPVVDEIAIEAQRQHAGLEGEGRGGEGVAQTPLMNIDSIRSSLSEPILRAIDTLSENVRQLIEKSVLTSTDDNEEADVGERNTGRLEEGRKVQTRTTSSISEPILRTVDRIGMGVRQIGHTTVRTIIYVPLHLANAIVAGARSKLNKKTIINIISDDPSTLLWLQQIVSSRPNLRKRYTVRRFDLTSTTERHDPVRNIQPDEVTLVLGRSDDRTINLLMEVMASRPDIDPRRWVSVVQDREARRTLRALVDDWAIMGSGDDGGQMVARTTGWCTPEALCVNDIHEELFAYARYLLTRGYSAAETEDMIKKKLL